MRQWQFNLIVVAICSVIVFGCSPKWHINRAIKKDPSIQKEYVDTLKFTQTFLDTIYTSDSTFYIEQKIVHYDTIVKYTKVQADFSEMKNWWETLQENKTERKKIKNDRKKEKVQIKQEGKTNRTQIRQDSKTERGGSWWWIWIAIGVFIGVVVPKVFNKTMGNLKF